MNGSALIPNIIPKLTIDKISMKRSSFPFQPNVLNFKAIIGTFATSKKLETVMITMVAINVISQLAGKKLNEAIIIVFAGVGNPIN